MKALYAVLMLMLAPLGAYPQMFGPAIKYGTGFTLLPRGESNFDDLRYLKGTHTSIDLEYTYYHDRHLRYSSGYWGFTTGIRYQKTRNVLFDIYNYKELEEVNHSIAIPALIANKRWAWQNGFRAGLIASYDYSQKRDGGFAWNTRPWHLDLYFSCGFDHRLTHRTDGWILPTELFMQYTLLDHIYRDNLPNRVRLLKVGIRVGIGFDYDYYHYRGHTRFKPKYNY